MLVFLVHYCLDSEDTSNYLGFDITLDLPFQCMTSLTSPHYRLWNHCFTEEDKLNKSSGMLLMCVNDKKMKHTCVTDRSLPLQWQECSNYYTKPILTPGNAVRLRLAKPLNISCTLYKTNHIGKLMRTFPFWKSTHTISGSITISPHKQLFCISHWV